SNHFLFSPQFLLLYNHPATTEIYTLSLHDALPISVFLARKLEIPTSSLWHIEVHHLRFLLRAHSGKLVGIGQIYKRLGLGDGPGDRKSTRLNSSHVAVSYAVFCLKKKK